MAEGKRWCYLSVERSHRNLESREGSLEYHPGQGCVWLRQRHPHNDQSQSPVIFFDWLQAEMYLGNDDQRDGLC